jgi:hypothetical protein
MTTREWLYAVLALTGGVLGGLAGSKLSSAAGANITQIPPQTVEAQQILLVDAKGHTRGAFGLNKDGDPGLSLYDHQGKLRTALEIDDAEGLRFKLFDISGALRLSLMINSDQVPAVRLFDAQNRLRALFGVDPGGEPALDFYSQDGKLLRELP